MNSRNGYEAIAIRSRAAAGNCIFGAESPVNAVLNAESAAKIFFSPGHIPAQTNVPTAGLAACARNRLRVVIAKTAPV
jgi:hypothetical protein